MAGKRRATASSALAEIAGILFMLAALVAISIAFYKLGGIWLAIVPGSLAFGWVGFNMAARRQPPGGTGTGTAGGTRNGTDPKVDYVDPDEAVPTDVFERYQERY